MPATRNATAPVTPKRQRAPSNRARKPSTKALRQNEDDDSDLETITLPTDVDGSWTPRYRGAQEANGATALGAPYLGTPSRAEVRGRPREHEKRRNDNTARVGNKETTRFEFASGGEGRGTGFDELASLILNLKKTITQQTNVIEKQNDTIEVIRADLAEIKEEQQQLVRQNAELQEQVYSLQSQVSTLTASPPTPSWAAVAGQRSKGGPTQLTQNATASTNDNFARRLPSPPATIDGLYCVIDTSKVAEEDTGKTSPGAIRTIIEKEIRATNGQDNWRCRAVTRETKNTSRVKIACRDETEQQMIRQAAETKLASGIRVLRDELYPIKVDSVNRLAVLDERGEIRMGTAEALGRENETTVAKMAWLSNKDVAKAYGSMVVYLTKASDARRLLTEGYFHVAGESGYSRIFERRLRPEQCFNCQELGHKAFQCKSAQKCVRYADGGHRHSECTETVLKCVPCGGPHESFSRNCRKLYPSQHE
jgi:regulator of replication initiation timing